MTSYEQKISKDLRRWQKKMQSSPSLVNKLSKKVQTKLNSYIPDKVHEAISAAIKQMVKGVLFGAKMTTSSPEPVKSLELTEAVILERIEFYKKTGAVEGGITGAGGILMAFADFPLLMGIKIKMLFDIAVRYGYSIKDYRERLYLLHIFQLAFSSHEHRKNVYDQMVNWKARYENLPEDVNEFDWLKFQQEYRDYIDLAKLAQMVPVIGAAVGTIVNYRLIRKLGQTAMQAYRMRIFEEKLLTK